jgi:hypothetical protein
MHLKLLSAALLTALVIAPAASAGAPYRFASRTAFERLAAKQFVITARKRLGGGRWVVRSIGCSKGGAGRGYCAVVANGPDGTQPYELAILCASDRGNDCTSYVEQWTAR